MHFSMKLKAEQDYIGDTQHLYREDYLGSHKIRPREWRYWSKYENLSLIPRNGFALCFYLYNRSRPRMIIRVGLCH